MSEVEWVVRVCREASVARGRYTSSWCLPGKKKKAMPEMFLIECVRGRPLAAVQGRGRSATAGVRSRLRLVAAARWEYGCSARCGSYPCRPREQRTGGGRSCLRGG